MQDRLQTTASPTSSPIRARRRELRITQAELAVAASVSRQTVISIEQGDYAPSVYLALRIAKALDSRVEDLFILEEARSGEDSR